MPAPSGKITARLAAALLPLLFLLNGFAQNCPDPFNPLKQNRVTGLNIPGTDNIHGYLEHLPADYYSSSKKYPLLIYIHGVNETGPGTAGELCRLLYEWNWEPPVQVELNKFPLSVKDQNGQSHSFILISPQLAGYYDPSGTFNSFIDYLLGRYRIDASMIYLTGVSAGADYVLSFVAGSVNNAKRIAGVTPVAQCGGISSQGARNISEGGTHIWGFKCEYDNCGGSGWLAKQTADAINAINPPANLAWHTTYPTVAPQPEWPCNTPEHNIWGRAYDTLMKQYVYGRLVNMYEWMVQYRQGAQGPLPVTLEKYDVRLNNGKVYVKWKTSFETNSDHFTIERAGENQVLTPVATMPAAGSESGKAYEWIDEQPLANLSYYRLTQTDKDGKKQYFGIRKIMNRLRWDRYAVVSPNPFKHTLSVFLHVDKVERVSIALTDMNGKMIKRINGIYNEGTVEVKLDAANWSQGMYLLKVEGSGFKEVHKVIKE